MKPAMRVVFLGASRFGLRCLRAIADLPGCTVVGAVTAPPTFPISYRPQGVTNVLHADVAGWCSAHGIPSAQLGPEAMRDQALLETVRNWHPDAFVVAGWYHMVPKSWRTLAPAYGLHASLLPEYRGGAPLVWAVINGERRTGITLFRFDDGVDTGPVVAQAATPITPDDTIATLYERIETLGESLLLDALPRLARGELAPRPQPAVHSRVWPQRGPEDGRIDWSQPAARLADFVRAQSRPYPGAFFEHAGSKVTVWSARAAVAPAALGPGQFAEHDGRVLAGAGSGTAVELLEIAVDERGVAPIEWLAGAGLRETPNSRKYRFADFTHASYRGLLQAAKANYTFRTYGDAPLSSPVVLWRHDLDFSVLDAVPLAHMEAQAGVVATYFVNLHDGCYNPLDRANAAAIREVLGQGHVLGLHFDAGFHGIDGDAGRLAELLRIEAGILRDFFGSRVEVFSFHNPDAAALAFDGEEYGGLRNTYARSLRGGAAYCSDSNGYWRHERLHDVLARPASPVLQVLTHPCWWTAQVMSPRQKIERTVASLSAAILDDYARTLAAGGRSDIDW